MEAFRVGTPCSVVRDGRAVRGAVRFCGPTQFASGVWVGVELAEPVGKNAGEVQGVNYFHCRPRCGLFLRPEEVALSSSTGTPRGFANGTVVHDQRASAISRIPYESPTVRRLSPALASPSTSPDAKMLAARRPSHILEELAALESPDDSVRRRAERKRREREAREREKRKYNREILERRDRERAASELLERAKHEAALAASQAKHTRRKSARPAHGPGADGTPQLRPMTSKHNVACPFKIGDCVTTNREMTNMEVVGFVFFVGLIEGRAGLWIGLAIDVPPPGVQSVPDVIEINTTLQSAREIAFTPAFARPSCLALADSATFQDYVVSKRTSFTKLVQQAHEKATPLRPLSEARSVSASTFDSASRLSVSDPTLSARWRSASLAALATVRRATSNARPRNGTTPTGAAAGSASDDGEIMALPKTPKSGAGSETKSPARSKK